MCFPETSHLQWFIPTAANALYFPEGIIMRTLDTHTSLQVLRLRFLKDP